MNSKSVKSQKGIGHACDAHVHGESETCVFTAPNRLLVVRDLTDWYGS